MTTEGENSTRFYLLLLLGGAAVARIWMDLVGHATDVPFDGASLAFLGWSLFPYIVLALCGFSRSSPAGRAALFVAAVLSVCLDLTIAYQAIFLPTSSTSALALLFLPPVTLGAALLLWLLLWAVFRFC